jgi:hypothetical protein
MNERLAHYPLLTALIERRTRRFGKGMRLDGGPLAFASAYPPQPLTIEEEAALAFAACGITGSVLAELPYESSDAPESGGGNIMAQFIGRTVASPDALHIYTIFVINDDGVWMLKRPQDFDRTEYADLIQAARQQRLVDLYERSRVRISKQRAEIPRQVPFTHAFNKWSANVPGTTYFLPIAELTAPYINGLLFTFSEDFAGFPLDEGNFFLPAGIGKFARSKGGHLFNDPKDERSGPLGFVETWLYEAAAIEQGAILQNLALMTQALGLGGFPHFAAHPYIWFKALGFRMQEIRASKIMGLASLLSGIARTIGKDFPVPSAIGLEREKDILLKPFCPPYYRDMEEAVLAFLDFKYAQGKGTLRDGGKTTAWQDGEAVQTQIPPYSDRTIAATIAYCDYVYKRSGRLPAGSGPFRTTLAYQAHHLDPDFYERFYCADALTETQRTHQAHWHNSD